MRSGRLRGLVCVGAHSLKEWQIETRQYVFELLSEMIVQIRVQTEVIACTAHLYGKAIRMEGDPNKGDLNRGDLN